MPSGPARHGPSASQSQHPKTGPGSVLTAQVPHNRKKAKRRAKEAAKKAAEQSSVAQETASPPATTPVANGTGYSVPGAFDQNTLDSNEYPTDGLGPDDPPDGFEAANEEYYYSEADGAYTEQGPQSISKSKKKKKKNRGGSISLTNHHQDEYYDPHHPYSNEHPPPPPPPLPHDHGFGHERIWNTSGSEERENIKEFWLSLEETERRSLVKVEKEAVLKKMKEQQKHSCSCSVCGRKRTAIEEELEVLYDAYYEELEQYANHRVVLEDGTVITGADAVRHYPSVPGRLPPFVGQNGPQSRFQEEAMDDEDELEAEEFYSDEEEFGDDYDDDETRPQAAEFLNFGNSLTVQGGILTVADDLLKNDGKKFIEMMEQLAERRMRREEQAQYDATAGLGMGHTHGRGGVPLDDDEDDDEGYEEDEYATEEEGYPEDDVGEDELEEEEAVRASHTNLLGDELTALQEGMTEEQRMEEGRRMFQIFAARMFEQRVLTAYREKVARERQDKLLEELEDEKDRDAEREAQKARKSAKNKEKKLRQKQQKEEEKAKREAERQAAADALKREEEQRAEEQRRKKEEQRKKRDEERRKQEEEKTKKEEEKRRKQAEAKRLLEEQERKQKEQKEKEKQRREDAKRRELEDKAAKEKEAKERREREMAEKKERDAMAKAEKQASQQAKKIEHQQAKSLQQGHPVPVPPLLRKQTSNASVPSASNLHTSAQPSPHLQIATPVIPKAPSPGRPRQASQQGSSVQGSYASSPKSAQVPSGSSSTSPSTTQQVPASMSQVPVPVPKNNAPNQLPQQHQYQQQQQQQLQQPQQQQQQQRQPSTHAHSNQPLAPPPGMSFPMNPPPGMLMNGFPSGFGPQPHPPHSRFPPGHDPAMFGNHGFGGGPFRGFNNLNGMPYPPPGMNGFRGMTGPPGISPISATSPGPPGGFGMHAQGFPQAPGQRTQPHSRQPSASLDKAIADPSSNAPAQPIGPPAPIKRPSSSGEKNSDQVDEPNKQLGSSALLEDDAPVDAMPRDMQAGPTPFNSAPIFQEPFRGPSNRAPFASPGLSGGPFSGYSGPGAAGAAGWAAPPGQHFVGAGGGGGAAPGAAAGSMFTVSRHQPRAVWLRTMAIEACNRLSKSPHLQGNQQGGFHSIDAIAAEVNAMKPQNELPVPKQELLDICDTEGNLKNGGGTFLRSQAQGGSIWIKFERDTEMPSSHRHSVDAIGSPLVSNATPSFGSGGGTASGGAPGFGPPPPRFAAPGGGVSGF